MVRVESGSSGDPTCPATAGTLAALDDSRAAPALARLGSVAVFMAMNLLSISFNKHDRCDYMHTHKYGGICMKYLYT